MDLVVGSTSVDANYSSAAPSQSRTGPEERGPRPVLGMGAATFFYVLSPVTSSPSPIPQAAQGWSRLIPTGTSLFGTREIGARADGERWRSVHEQLETTARFLSLTKMELKDALGISRQTLYEWLAGKYSPGLGRQERIDSLEELALLVKGELGKPLPVQLLRAKRPGQPSLLEALKSDASRIELRQLVEVACAQAPANKAKSAEALRQRLGFKPRTAEQQERALSRNLDVPKRK